MTEWLEKAFGGLPQTAPRPPPVEPPKKKGACAGSEAALRACLETHTKCFEGNPDATLAECFKSDPTAAEKCYAERYAFFQCKRSVWDMRSRLRGRRNE